MPEKRKTIIIGWDGATFNILDKMIAKGLMPNLENILQNSAHAELFSTIPPITGPSWSSFRTGRRPENHGIFSFLKSPEESLDIDDIEGCSAKNIDGISFWNILNHHGLKTIIADLPLTDPVEKINGVMVSGMMTRGKRGVLTHPENLKEILASSFPDSFKQTLTDGLGVSLKYLDRLIDSIREKQNLDLFLLNSYDWDVFVSVYSATDTLQHYFWKFLDVNSKQYTQSSKFLTKIFNFFSLLDKTLSTYLEYLRKNDNLIIISDHGFGANNYTFYVNNFLYNQGHLQIRRGKSKGFINSDKLKQIISRYDLFNFRRLIKKESRERFAKVLNKKVKVDWSKTQAFFRANNEYGIYININSKYFQGSVGKEDYQPLIEKIIGKLKNATSPYTNEKIFNKIYSKYEVFKDGKYTENAPDIIMIPEKGINLKGFDLSHLEQIIRENKSILSGFHEKEGIFIGYGRDFKKGYKANPFSIYDISPLILYLFNLQIDKHMDGKINTDILAEDSKNYRIKKGEYRIKKRFAKDDSYDNEKEIEQLKGLGYI